VNAILVDGQAISNRLETQTKDLHELVPVCIPHDETSDDTEEAEGYRKGVVVVCKAESKESSDCKPSSAEGQTQCGIQFQFVSLQSVTM
jgi:hypothetical protein